MKFVSDVELAPGFFMYGGSRRNDTNAYKAAGLELKGSAFCLSPSTSFPFRFPFSFPLLFLSLSYFFSHFLYQIERLFPRHPEDGCASACAIDVSRRLPRLSLDRGVDVADLEAHAHLW